MREGPEYGHRCLLGVRSGQILQHLGCDAVHRLPRRQVHQRVRLDQLRRVPARLQLRYWERDLPVGSSVFGCLLDAIPLLCSPPASGLGSLSQEQDWRLAKEICHRRLGFAGGDECPG